MMLFKLICPTPFQYAHTTLIIKENEQKAVEKLYSKTTQAYPLVHCYMLIADNYLHQPPHGADTAAKNR